MFFSRLNQVWLSDITYIRIRTGFVYLAAILDAYSRRVIGYAVSTKLDTALTLEALRIAIALRFGANKHRNRPAQHLLEDLHGALLELGGFCCGIGSARNVRTNPPVTG